MAVAERRSGRAGGDVTDDLPDAELLRSHVRDTHRQVAVAPAERHHVHTGRPLAAGRAAWWFRHGPLVSSGLPRGGWQTMLEQAGFANVGIGEPVDTFAGAHGEPNARTFEVFGFAFSARRP